MNVRAILALAVIAAALIPTTSAATAAPTGGEIDISGAELAGSVGGVAINVFGTLRCDAAGPLTIDVDLFQASTGGMAAGGNNGLGCPAPGDLIKWVVTANSAPGTFFVVGEKVTITAIAAGSTIATDTEDHVLRWGR
jgi:hypothetical protein